MARNADEIELYLDKTDWCTSEDRLLALLLAENEVRVETLIGIVRDLRERIERLEEGR